MLPQARTMHVNIWQRHRQTPCSQQHHNNPHSTAAQPPRCSLPSKTCSPGKSPPKSSTSPLSSPPPSCSTKGSPSSPIPLRPLLSCYQEAWSQLFKEETSCSSGTEGWIRRLGRLWCTTLGEKMYRSCIGLSGGLGEGKCCSMASRVGER